MRTRSLDARRSYPRFSLAAATMLALTLAAGDAAQAQERAPDVQPAATPLVAIIQAIDPTDVGVDPASGVRAGPVDDAVPEPTADGPQAADSTLDQATSSVTVSATLPKSDRWDAFRESVGSAATPSCFGSDALPHEEFAVDGLLRLPFLAQAAATGTCR
jgi:hypothetical protein